MATRAAHLASGHTHGLSFPAVHVSREVMAGLFGLVVWFLLCFILIYAVAMPLGDALVHADAL